MARLPALVEAIAEYDWRPKSLISHFGKTVRTAKLILSERTGTGAAEMTYADAVTLLMAIGGSVSPAGAEAAVENLRSLERRPWDDIDRMMNEDLVPELDFMRPEMNFAMALETMIRHADKIWEWERQYQRGWDSDERGSLELKAMERMVEKSRSGLAPFVPGFAKAVRVIFYQPGLAAEIHLGRAWTAITDNDAFHEFYVAPPSRLTGIAPIGTVGSIEVDAALLLALKKAVETPTRVVKRPGRSPDLR